VPRDRFSLIPVGTTFSHARDEAGAVADVSPVIASVGRLERYKGHHRLIEALPEILRRRPDVRVWIAGEGPYEEKLRTLAKALHVSDRVDIRAVPVSQPEELARELSRAALVVLLSDYETQSVAALEAIALGRPLLVLYTTGLKDLADRGLASAIPRNSSSSEVASAVLDQLADPFVPAEAELPTWDDCAKRHLDLYTTLTYTSVRSSPRAVRPSC
jgi:glycosyltransferase involved in cell wall biosynthesis